ncbi:MAG TPA: hypothetical protein EYP77_08555 [Anaerolineae bacterium]|nr:hypothetical protein [Anaerolineae bacterium]
MIELGSALFALRGKVCELLPLERVLATAFHKEPDRVPAIPFIIGAARRFTGATYEDFSLRAEEAAQAYITAVELIGGDALYNVIDLSVEAAQPLDRHDGPALEKLARRLDGGVGRGFRFEVQG